MHRFRVLAATVALTLPLALAACGDDGDEPSSTSEPTAEPTTEPTAEGDDGTEAASTDAFPVSIEHAYGTTTIEAKPERVAAVAWANHEVPLALGIVPVGMSKATWGDDDGDGMLPWVKEKIDELGGETPELFDETDGIAFEAVAATQPDVILAAYSGLTQSDYDTLSKIAPVIAYPDVAWGTPLEDMVTMSAEALGLSAQGTQLNAELDAQVAASLAKHPELDGKGVMFAFVDPNDLSKVGFYTTHDTRPGFLARIGMKMPALVEEASAESDEFYVNRSAEDLDAFSDVDIIVTYGDDALAEQIESDPVLAQIPAVANGAVVVLEDSTPIAAAANPSPLSIGWGIDTYLELLAEAVAPA